MSLRDMFRRKRPIDEAKPHGQISLVKRQNAEAPAQGWNDYQEVWIGKPSVQFGGALIGYIQEGRVSYSWMTARGYKQQSGISTTRDEAVADLVDAVGCAGDIR